MYTIVYINGLWVDVSIEIVLTSTISMDVSFVYVKGYLFY